MVRAIGVRETGGPEVLVQANLPAEELGTGEVRLRVTHAAVNPTDTLIRAGVNRTGDTAILVPGMDAAGVVTEVGPGVTRPIAVGDHVMAIVRPQGEHGAYREDLVLPADSVSLVPTGVSDAAASTLPMNALTAQLALDTLALPPGATIAVTGAAGTLGGYVVELAKDAGLTVVADAKPSDEQFVTSCGADVVVARGQDFAAAVRGHFPDGVDGLVDCALLDAAALPAVGDGGAVATVRGYRGDGARDVRVEPVMVRTYVLEGDKLDRIGDLAAKGAITLRVAGEFPAADAAEAHRLLEAGGSRGRYVLRFD